MDFGANKTPVEVIKGGAFGGRYFKDIYSRDTGKCYKVMERIWFQWYFRYWLGRSSSDDERQINR